MSDTPTINKAYVLLALNLGLVSSERMLQGTNKSLADLEAINDIDVSLAVQLVKNMALFSPDPNWPSTFGTRLGAASHGAVGYATLSAATVGLAIKTFCEWFRLRCDVYDYSITQDRQQVCVAVQDTTQDTLFQSFFFEAFSRALEVLLELLVGAEQSKHINIEFIDTAAERHHSMAKMYLSSIKLGGGKNAILIPNTIWYQSSPLSDRNAYEFNIRQCQQLLAEKQLSGRIDLQVKQLLKQHFALAIAQQSAVPLPPSQEQICQKLHITPRTLIRKLKIQKQSYQAILDQERQQLAEAMLTDARFSIYQVAERLGYKEPANFCRAFKRWTGKSPSQYRRGPEN
ncbi:MAG: helix-turn-helix domain-containing protein [Aestuariibacter sp.]